MTSQHTRTAALHQFKQAENDSMSIDSSNDPKTAETYRALTLLYYRCVAESGGACLYPDLTEEELRDELRRRGRSDEVAQIDAAILGVRST
jgi:hypothetical protein